MLIFGLKNKYSYPQEIICFFFFLAIVDESLQKLKHLSVLTLHIALLFDHERGGGERGTIDH